VVLGDPEAITQGRGEAGEKKDALRWARQGKGKRGEIA
jgi:hypothetical protein